MSGDVSKGRKAFDDVVHAWPIIVSVLALSGLLGSTLGKVWVNDLIEAKHASQAEIVSPAVQDLKLLISSAAQTATANSDSIARVESKVDRLLLILTENGRQ